MRLIIIFCFLIFSAFAQEGTVRLKDQKAIQNDIDAVGDLTPSSYYSQIDTYRESIEKFFVTKKKVCQGEYAPFILSGEGEKKLPSKTKIEDREKRQCFKELRKMHGAYLENMYKARRRFLEANHKDRLDELSRHYEQSLKDLQTLYPN